MNLQKLFETQRILDEKIVKEKSLEGQYLLDKKILALQVELGELAQNWQGFMFWSNDQEPRKKKRRKCPTCNGNGIVSMGEDMRGIKVCPDCDSYRSGIKTTYPLLEKYVDCLHFILSIGLEIDVCPDELDIEPTFCANITEQFIDLFYEISRLRYEEINGQLYEDYLQYKIVLEHFVGLGIMLDFTWEEIDQAYYAEK